MKHNLHNLITKLSKKWKAYILVHILFLTSINSFAQHFYPVHETIQFIAPYGAYLSDYYSGSRDKLIITLYNRDLDQPILHSRLRIKIQCKGFTAQTREEMIYPMLELYANTPQRLTSTDLSPYLQPGNLVTNGSLNNGRIPTGTMEFSVQTVDYYTGKALSNWHTARAYIDIKKPPILNLPHNNENKPHLDPQFISFQWQPRHQGLANTEYEFTLKELPDNGVSPQSAFAYGNEIYQTITKTTTLNYNHLLPILYPNKKYAWQVRAIAKDGIDEINIFENNGYSEIRWFTIVNKEYVAPTGLKHNPKYTKVDLSWDHCMQSIGYVVACRPKTENNKYEWSTKQANQEQLTIPKLKPGWTYEWRVGALYQTLSPIFSQIKEFTIPEQNQELLDNCGKEFKAKEDLLKDPNLHLNTGDIVIIGGDYPMTITSLTHLGGGRYSGEGKTRLKTILDAQLKLKFDDLLVNIENYQIGGTVRAIYDENNSKIIDLDQIDDGGKKIKTINGIKIKEQHLDFVLPDIPQIVFYPEKGELEFKDIEGTTHIIPIDIPSNADYNSIFPMRVVDKEGKTYQISKDSESASNELDEKENKPIKLKAEQIEQIGIFEAEELSTNYGTVTFEEGNGKYAFDNGKQDWYKKSVKLDKFYKPFGKDYIAPWKFIPTGAKDVVKAYFNANSSNTDITQIKFATKDGISLPAELDTTSLSWNILLVGGDNNTSYDVYAVYKNKTIGKIHILSYQLQEHKVTIVPINDININIPDIEQQLNSIYNKVGITIKVSVDECLRGNYKWDIADEDGEPDGKLGLVGKSFWGYDKELKESTEMINLQNLYKDTIGNLEGVYLFVLNGAKGLDASSNGLLGEMPRKSQFGYIFSNENSETSDITYTIAHELGHGIFTLQHTFDNEYGKKESKGTTLNLMDYGGGSELAAFQWNIMANPAIFTGFDKVEDAKMKLLNTIELFKNLRLRYKYKYLYKSSKDNGGDLKKGSNFFKYITEKDVYIYFTKDGNAPISFVKRDNVYTSFYDTVWHKIEISGLGSINCFSKKDRDVIYGFLTGENDNFFIDLYEPELESLNSITENTSEKIVVKLIEQLTHPILFSTIKLDTRINILSALLKEDVDDGFWELNNKFFLDELIFSVPKEGRLRILKKFMENNYKWVEILWEKSTGVFNNDITIIDIIPLITELGKWIKEYYSELNIPITTNEIKDIVLSNVNIKYPVAAETPICLGIKGDGSSFFYLKTIDRVQYNLDIQDSKINFEEGRINFTQKFVGTLNGVYITDKEIQNVLSVRTELNVSPFEPVYLIARRNYNDFGIKNKDEFFVPAFIAATYLQCLIDKESTDVLRSIGNGIAIGAAVISIPYTGGGSWAAYTTIAAGVVAGLDEALASGRLKLGSSDEYDEKYKDFYQAWDALYYAVSAADVAVNTPRLFNYMRHINIAKASKNLYQKTKGLNNVALSGKVTNLFKNIKVTNFSKLEGNRQFLSILGRTKVKDIGAFKNKFTELHKLCKTNDVNSVKSLDDVIGDFDNLISHLSDKNQTQMVKFINEMLESRDKFKAAATTLEVVKNPQKYISIKNLTNLELEDLISTAEGAGKYRFDIKWSAEKITSQGKKKGISIFVDTKNYSSANNMFQDLKQFKAYLREINDFDQLHIVQQSRNGITLEKVIAQLEKAIAKDATGVYRAKSQLWMNMNIDSPEMLRKLAENKKLSTDPSYQAFRNIIKLTK